MQDIYRNQATNNFDVPISEEEWEEILCLTEVHQNSNILWALEKWYSAPNYTASCKSLSKQYNRTCNFFSVQNRILGKIAVRYLNKFRLIGENGKETFWGIAWIELKKEHGIYILKLRPNLVSAIKNLDLFPYGIKAPINVYLQMQDLSKEKHFIYKYEKRKKITLKKQFVKQYLRNPIVAKNALAHADFKCEINTSHYTFPRMKDGLPYMETHHLVPLKFSDKFAVSLDVPENIICLCSNCHNRIHYGKDRQKLIEFLWRLRYDDLHKVGIDITIDDLLSFYNVFE